MDNVRVTLSIGSTILVCNPVFGDDMKLKISRQDGQMFNRVKMDGKVLFVGKDFDFIADASHNIKFTISVYSGNTLLGTGDFFKSDCSLDYDNKRCEVKLNLTDRYEKFLNNYDNKYNLVSLLPEITPLTLTKRPVLQLYAYQDSHITNIIGNMAFEAGTINDAPSRSQTDLANNQFTKLFHRVIAVVSITSQLKEEDAGVNGEYSCIYTSGTPDLWNADNTYCLRCVSSSYGQYIFGIFDSNGNRIESSTGYDFQFIINSYQSDFTETEVDITLVAQGSPVVGTLKTYSRIIYARLLCDTSVKPSGWLDTPVEYSTLSNDVSENLNYKYVCAVRSYGELFSNVYGVLGKQTTPTPYGDGNGEYYPVPSPWGAGYLVTPIGPSMWDDMSFWLQSTVAMQEKMDNYFAVPYTLRDTFPLYSAIAKLLEQVDSSVSFEGNRFYSEFFYSNIEGLQAMLPTPLLRNDSQPYITPITNVKKTRYEQAAQRGDITLKQILDMLRIVYQCYWYIDDSGRLRIEHISFFKGGKKYVLGAPAADIDVTQMVDYPTKEKWTFDTNKIDFDTKECPSRYEFEWGGTSSAPFNGAAIVVNDLYVNDGNKEKMSVTNFVADIDFVVANPSEVSDDIYALIEANGYGVVEIPRVSLGGNNPVYSSQNGYCSLLYTIPHYWIYDLGGWDASFGGVSLNVLDTKRFAKQEIGFPLYGNAISPEEIISVKTGLGTGTLEELEVNADTKYAKSKILLSQPRDYSALITVTKITPSPSTPPIYNLANGSNVALRVWVAVTDGYYSNTEVQEHIIEPQSFVTFSTANDVAILSVERYGLVQTDEFVAAVTGGMTLNPILVESERVTLEICGNDFEGLDWGYIRMRCEKRTRITITSSSEEDYDYGYVAYTPYDDRIDIEQNALAYASGTGDSSVAEVTIEAGSVVYLGYSKDSALDGDDKITFDAEVVE